MTVTVDPITLQLAFQRLEFETGFDVNALIEERDALKREVESLTDSLQQSWAYEETLHSALDPMP